MLRVYNICRVKKAFFNSISKSQRICRTISSVSSDNQEKNNSHILTENGERILYKGNQQFTVRAMFGLGCLNICYWGAQIANNYFYKDVVIQGISLAADPIWGYVGSFATVFIVYFSREYAHHSVYYSYKSVDNNRIGFQTHNILGNPGRKFEISIGKARAVNSKQITNILENIGNDNISTSNNNNNSKNNSLLMRITSNSSTIPIKVEGIQNNILIDKTGLYYNDYELIKIITPPYGIASTEKIENSDKINRINWKKNSYHQSKKGKSSK